MDNSSLIKSPISEELEDFKKLFESTLSSSNLLLNSVIAHIRQKNGKMMRPILVLLAAKLFGKVCPATLHAAVALELLHNASLVHDDVVDESTERRGQLSVNAIFNNKVAVLAGDYLLATALVQVSMTRNHDIIDIVSCLGQDLADGELLQLSNVSNLHFSEEVYFDVIRKKTAVLFAACTKAGALSVVLAFSPWKIPAGATGGCTWAGPPAAMHPPRSHHAPAPQPCPRHPTSPSRSPVRERGCGIPSAPPMRGRPANRQIGLCNPPQSPCASRWSIARSPGEPAKGEA